MKNRKLVFRGKLRYVLLIVCVVCFLISAGMVLHHWNQARHTREGVARLQSVLDRVARQGQPEGGKMPQLAPGRFPGFDALHEMNQDFVGWLTIQGTGVDYPVMQSAPSQPEYYLRRNFEQEYDINGLPFLDARCSLDPADGNLIVYGHNMRSGLMFHDLLSYRRKAYFEEHPTIIFDTLYERGIYEIAAVLLYDASSAADAFKPHRLLNFDREEEFDDYLRQLKAAAYYDTGVELVFGDRLLTLATCDRTILDNGRLVVVAKKLDG